MLVVSPDGSRLYTANLRSGSVTVIDLIKGTAIAQITTGAGCEGIDVSPDGREVWTANKEADTVSIISTATNTVCRRAGLPGPPDPVKFTPDGQRALVSCASSGEVAVFQVSTRREHQRIATGGAPIGLVIEPSGHRAYVANTDANQVSIIDLATLTVTGTLPLAESPMAWRSSGRENDRRGVFPRNSRSARMPMLLTPVVSYVSCGRAGEPGRGWAGSRLARS